MNLEWNINPLIGVGPIELGMSTEQISKFNHIFGEVTSRDNETSSIDAVVQTLMPYIDSVPGIRENIEQMRAGASNCVKEFRHENAPILDYRNDKLFRIILSARCTKLHYNSILAFEHNSSKFVSALHAIDKKAVFMYPEIRFLTKGIGLQHFVRRTRSEKFQLKFSSAHEHDDRIVIITTHSGIIETSSDFKPLTDYLRLI